MGASGVATARNDCNTVSPNSGFIVGHVLDELVIDGFTGTSCTVVGSTINGDVRVTAEGIGFTMKASIVNGNLRVKARLQSPLWIIQLTMVIWRSLLTLLP